MTKQLRDTLKLMSLVLAAQLLWALLVLLSPFTLHMILLTTSYLMSVVMSLLIFINYKDKIKYEVPFFILTLVLNYFVILEVMPLLSR